MANNSEIKDSSIEIHKDKKALVYQFIKEHGEVFNFELVKFFSQRYTICADRLARFLVAEGKINRREPTEEEKARYNLTARTIIWYIPNGKVGQIELNLGG